MTARRDVTTEAALEISSEQEAFARRELLQETLHGAHETRALEDGLALGYPATRRWSQQLAEFTDGWARRHPLVTTAEVSGPQDGLIWLRIHAPVELRLALEYQIRRSRDGRSRRSRRLGHLRGLLPRVLTSPLRVMPGFVIIGAARAGTSTLYHWLTGHPSVVGAFRKEVYFFDRTYGRGSAWYRAFFPTLFEMRRAGAVAGGRAITGEATPDYLFHPHAARRLASVLPDAKLIVALRNPIDRAYSFYQLQLRRCIETLPFEEAIEQEEERLHGELEQMLVDETYFSFARQNYSYIARGIYADQLDKWRRHFAPDQILILSSEEFDEDPAGTSAELTRHLELPAQELPKRDRLNALRYPGLGERVRERLVQYFRPHNERLYEMVGRDFGWDR